MMLDARSIRWLTLATLATLSACVSYEDPEPELTNPGDTGAERPEPPEREPRADLRLSPAGGLQDQAIIVSLLGDHTVDLRQVTALTFFGDSELEVLAVATRGPDEYLMTLDIPPDAPRGVNHLLIDLADGSMKFVEDAFEVVGDPIDVPPTEPVPNCAPL